MERAMCKHCDDYISHEPVEALDEVISKYSATSPNTVARHEAIKAAGGWKHTAASRDLIHGAVPADGRTPEQERSRIEANNAAYKAAGLSNSYGRAIEAHRAASARQQGRS